MNLDYSEDIFREFHNQRFGKFSTVEQLKNAANTIEVDTENWLFEKCEKIKPSIDYKTSILDCRVCGKFIPESPSGFLHNSIKCIEYNIEVLPGIRIKDKNSWIDAIESAICKSQYFGMEYAKRVIKGRWEPCEPAIIESNYYEDVIEYVQKCVKGRWIEGEKFLLKELKTSMRRGEFGSRGYPYQKVEEDWYNLRSVCWRRLKNYAKIINDEDIWKRIWLAERIAAA
jgi:hypothetical protein